LKISDQTGKNIGYHWDRESQNWELDCDPDQVITLKYQIALTHDQYNWNSAGGIDARPGLINDSTVIWVSKAVFIFPVNVEQNQFLIEFNLPEEWRISSAWQPAAASATHFICDELSKLVNNYFMVGKHYSMSLIQDSMQVEIALTAGLINYKTLIVSNLEKILWQYKRIFGELPDRRYLICASDHFFEDGEALNNSFYQLFLRDNLPFRQIIWSNILAHEMFHYWNGSNMLVSSSPESNCWFSEGFTEYYSGLCMVRSGIINKHQFLQKLVA